MNIQESFEEALEGATVAISNMGAVLNNGITLERVHDQNLEGWKRSVDALGAVIAAEIVRRSKAEPQDFG